MRSLNHAWRVPALLVLLALGGCIKNDIPYPVIKARFKTFEVYGQKDVVIDDALREVTITLEDTTNIRQVYVKNVKFTEEATCAPEIAATLDLSTPREYVLSTYQNYTWTVKATQTFDRVFQFDGQVGQATFDAENFIAVAYAPYELSLSDIKNLKLQLGPSNGVMSPDPATVTDFSEPQNFTVSYHDQQEHWQVFILHTATVVETYDPEQVWATKAVLSGSFQSGATAEHGFQYKKASDADWLTVPQEDVQTNGSQMSATIVTEAGTSYVYRAYLGTEYGEEVTFESEHPTQIPNMGFDDWIKDGKSWFPDLDLTEANYWWDSGNKGANTLGEKNPTEPEDVVVVQGRAARLGSTKILSVFAAGCIYTGQFLERVGFGAKLGFGRPYTSRPLRMKGYYNYTSGVIDFAKAPYANLKGKQDSCHIYALLADWDQPFEVNTTTNTFIDFQNDRGIIAFGELKTDQSTGGYKEFTIELEYRSYTRKPKYVLVVASASKYGDYFTGSTGSVLYVDEFAFEFE